MAVRVDWWVEYSDHGKPVFPSRAAVSTFSFTDRQIVGIAPITEVLHSSQFTVFELTVGFRHVTCDRVFPRAT